LQLRVDRELKLKLDKYAEFLDSTTAYVVSEALRLVFNKDAEFKKWLESQPTDSKGSVASKALVTSASAKQHVTTVMSPSKANGNELFR
jgi:predicted transcriptional regulator